MAINFIPSKDTDEECIMRLIKINVKAYKVRQAFQSLLHRYQLSWVGNINEKLRVCLHVHFLYYKCYNMNLDQGESYKDIYRDFYLDKKQKSNNKSHQ